MTENKKIGIASDHAGYELKEFLVGYLQSKGFDVHDFGTSSPESTDYPDYAHPLAEAIEQGELPRGLAMCGSGKRHQHDSQQTPRYPVGPVLESGNRHAGPCP